MIPVRRGRSLLVGALGLLLGACAAATPPPAPPPAARPRRAAPPPAPAAPTAPPPPVAPAPAPLSPRQQLAAGHKDKARRLESSGDLRQALDEWKIALTIDPADQAAQDGRRQLEARMERSIGERLSQGREALREGRPPGGAPALPGRAGDRSRQPGGLLGAPERRQGDPLRAAHGQGRGDARDDLRALLR